MNNNHKFLSVILAAGTAGVAVFTFSNTAFVAALPADVILSAGVSLAVLSFAVYDYSRPYLPLRHSGRTLRPSLPETASPRLASCVVRKDRAAA